jgi:hypothetical protein
MTAHNMVEMEGEWAAQPPTLPLPLFFKNDRHSDRREESIAKPLSIINTFHSGYFILVGSYSDRKDFSPDTFIGQQHIK